MDSASTDCGRILIVDDSLVHLSALSRILEGAGHEVATAQNGEDALDLLEDWNPEIIILDVQMPGMSGFETCEQIKKDWWADEIPILFMTGQTDVESKVKGFDLGGADYITKPFEEAELLARIRTHLKMLSLRRRLNEELAAKNKALVELDAFSHTVAHDIRNPLAGIIGLADCLIDNEEGGEFPELIKESGEQCLRILEEILLLASVRSEDVKPETIDMKESLGKAISGLSWLINDRNAYLEVPDSVPDALGRSGWVSQIWMNFISNAIKYGGTPPEVLIGYEVKEKTIRYWVEDNGSGISDEKKIKLFVPFSRLGQVKISGNGLGLSIVKRIIDRLNGTVGVIDAVEGGSRFFFELPR